MKVKVTKAFKARGELMPVGTVLKIRDEDFPKLIGKVEPVEPLTIDQMQAEYFTTLGKFWKIDKDPAATTEETRRIIARLDDLYRTLRKAGQRVPVRIPIERHRGQEQQPGLAL